MHCNSQLVIIASKIHSMKTELFFKREILIWIFYILIFCYISLNSTFKVRHHYIKISFWEDEKHHFPTVLILWHCIRLLTLGQTNSCCMRAFSTPHNIIWKVVRTERASHMPFDHSSGIDTCSPVFHWTRTNVYHSLYASLMQFLVYMSLIPFLLTFVSTASSIVPGSWKTLHHGCGMKTLEWETRS